VIFLHDAPDFADLIGVVGRELSIDPALIEKDYWIMHCLYGLQQMGRTFQLKGGTSLSKGFGLIHRFSEDIDIRIEPSPALPTGKNQNKPNQIAARSKFFDDLGDAIDIPGITGAERDHEFDDKNFRSAGIRLSYDSRNPIPAGVKEGVLLEAGFDQVTPNHPCDISSWAYDKAVASGVSDLIDNRAKAALCYDPGYTLVEKLQTISTKYRQQQETGVPPRNFMRHYYDVYCPLKNDAVRAFIGSAPYHAHKKERFRTGDDPNIATNEAFHLSDPETRRTFENAYRATRALYYREVPTFPEILAVIAAAAPNL